MRPPEGYMLISVTPPCDEPLLVWEFDPEGSYPRVMIRREEGEFEFWEDPHGPAGVVYSYPDYTWWRKLP